MNKTFQINLGGCLFSIDDDAFDYINQYLSSLRKHFSKSESCDEILSDIESRMAELFQEVLSGRVIIGMKEVEEVIAVMGKPEDFGAEPIEDKESEKTGSAQGSRAGFSPGKRLYRDPDDKKLGGVCSGISTYLGIDDPLWLRLLFVILFFTWGLGFFTYLILWILIPKASTTAEKLAMRGEPATFDNIARVIEEDVNDLGEKMKQGINQGKNGGFRGFLTGIINIISTLLGALFAFIIKFFKVILLVTAAILAFSLAASWVATIIGVSIASPILYYFGPADPGWTTMGIISAFLLLGIPVVMLILVVIHLLFRYRINRIFSLVAGVVWIVALITGGITASKTIQEFQSYSESTTTTDFAVPGNDLIINVPESEEGEDDFGVYFGMVQLDGEQLKIEDVHFRVEKSNDSLVHIAKEISARGRNRDEAARRVKQVTHTVTVTDSMITLSPYLEIPASDKYRGQKVEYILYIPEKKTVVYKGWGRHLKSGSDRDHEGIHLEMRGHPPVEM